MWGETEFQRPAAQRQLLLRRSMDGAVILTPRSNKDHSPLDVGLQEEMEIQTWQFNPLQPPGSLVLPHAVGCCADPTTDWVLL